MELQRSYQLEDRKYMEDSVGSWSKFLPQGDLASQQPKQPELAQNWMNSNPWMTGNYRG